MSNIKIFKISKENQNYYLIWTDNENLALDKANNEHAADIIPGRYPQDAFSKEHIEMLKETDYILKDSMKRDKVEEITIEYKGKEVVLEKNRKKKL